ncbi:MAG: hypothetical protein ACYCYI_10370 [Saccharofermentanales bacterium]
MDAPITITLYGLLITVLILTGLAALVLLIVLIIRLIKVIGRIDKFVETNSDPITASIKNLPAISENIAVVSDNMTGVTKSAGEILDGIDNFVESTAVENGGILGTITTVASLVRSVIQVIRNITGRDDE